MSFDEDANELVIGPATGPFLADMFLIDGNNLAYKAFFAIPDLTAPDGLPSNALYGFAMMLDRLVREYSPRSVCVAWDTKPQHRLDALESYKAHRKEMADELKIQFPLFPELVEAYGYQNVKYEGWEADDVLATLATRADARGLQVCIITNDRDAFQLVSDRVHVFTTPRGLSDPVVYDPQKVEERYGIPPRLVPDYLGLKGDPGDGIPGVPSIGEKTASALLVEYGDLDGVLAAASTIPGKKGAMLTEHADTARLSRQLATMNCNLPLDVTIDQLLVTGSRDKLRPLLERYGFSSLLKNTLDSE